MASSPWSYERILLKLSGEALMGDDGSAIAPDLINSLGEEVRELSNEGVQIAMVIGAGNIFRGVDLAKTGINRVTADQMGMLATVMNALAMKDVLTRLQCQASVMSAYSMPQVCDIYQCDGAKRRLSRGEVVIFAAGTGNPFFTTDTAATLRGIEVGAQLILKATKVDGVYSSDPVKHPEAIRYDRLSFDQVISQDLKVMDTSAILLCRDHHVPIRVYNMNKQGALRQILTGHNEGTLVE